jgi:hypothetical protein
MPNANTTQSKAKDGLYFLTKTLVVFVVIISMAVAQFDLIG